MKIKDIKIEERPRERLINYGVKSLSNAELLAIILNSGTKKISAIELANVILLSINNISELIDLQIPTLLKIKGIGIKKATTLIAFFELYQRINYFKPNINLIKFNNADAIYKYYEYLKDEKQEHFFVIYLDNSKKIIKEKLLFVGTINYSVVHPREIFKEAYLSSASAIICIHNHPSGETNPSKEDINLTNRLKEVGDLLGIKVIDHIIIGNTYYSFFENKLI